MLFAPLTSIRQWRDRLGAPLIPLRNFSRSALRASGRGKARSEIERYEGAIRCVQAQSPRQSECCADLGRKPSDGEPARPRM